MRAMAIDYGDAHTGVAISDYTGMIAGFAAVIHSREQDGVIAGILKVMEEYNVDELVVGLPKNMDGTEGPRAGICRAFAERLSEEAEQKVILWDERRTSVEAHNILHANGKKMKAHKQSVDAVAATLILEGYLNWKKMAK